MRARTDWPRAQSRSPFARNRLVGALVSLALAGLLGSGFGPVWAREEPPAQSAEGQEKKDDPPPPEAAPTLPVELQAPSSSSKSLALTQDILDVLIGVGALPSVGGSWVSQGPGPINNGQVEGITNRPVVGAVHTILAHPTNANVLWIGAVNGGIWRTTDALSASPTWTALGDGLGSLSVGAMDLDPFDSTSNTLVAGFGRFSSFSSIGGPRAGLVRTTDGGSSWTALGVSTLTGKNVSGVAARGAVIVASVNIADLSTCPNTGIFRSDDGGASFTKISGAAGSGLPSGRAFDLVGDPSNPDVLYAAIKDTPVCTPPANANGVYKSIDAGAHWARVNSAAMDALMGDAALTNIEMSVGRSSEVYAAIVVSGRLAGLFRSGDFGTSWTQLDSPQTTDGGVVNGIHPGGQGGIHMSVVADPTNPSLVYIGGDRQPSPFPNALGSTNFTGRLFRVDASQPAGTQARSLTNCPAMTAGCPVVSTTSNGSPHADSREIVVDANGDIVQADDGGLYRRTNPTGTGNWFSLMGNLRVTEMHDVAYDSVSNMILGGTQDVGTAEQTSVGGSTWNTVNQGDGGDVQVDDISSATQSTRYTSSQNLGSFFRRVVNAAGVTTSSAFPALTVTGGGPALVRRFVTPVELNGIAATRLLIAGNNDLYESLDRGDTITALLWNRAATAMVYGGKLGGVNNADVIYAINAAQVFKRTSAGGLLIQTTSSPGTSSLRDIAIDSSDWRKAYVINSIGQVFATADAGDTWTNVTGNLGSGSLDLRTIVFVPGTASAILVGGQGGVLQMPTGSPGSWSQFGRGMPNALVFDLEYDPADDILVAGTMGRGAWKITGVSGIVASTLSIGDASLTEGNAGTTNAVFTVTLSPANSQLVTVSFATANGTATAGTDYVSTSGSVSFAPGTTSQTVSVPVNGDTLIEGNETFFVNLSSPSNATIGDGQGQASVLDDDAGAIAGTLSDASSGALLPGVTVQVFNSAGTFVAAAASNASGSYSVPNLGHGSYFVRTFNSLGYVDELYDNLACAPCTVTNGTPVTVSPGVTTSGISFALASGGRISGTLTDASTPPLLLSGVTVQVYSAGGTFIASRTTDASGNYTIGAGLPTGTYHVRTLNSLGYVDELYDDLVCAPCSVTAGAPVPVSAPATTSAINFSLQRGGRVAGKVTDTNGAALSGVSVQIFSATGSFVTSGSSDALGNYTSGAGLPTGSYFARTSSAPGHLDELFDDIGCAFGCTVTNGAPIDVSAPATTGGVNFALIQGGRISGSVVAAATGARLAGVPVEISDSAGLLLSTATTSSAGVYTSIGLPAGSYFVRTRNLLGFLDELYNDMICVPCSPIDGTPVAVTTGATTSGIGFELERGGRISGRVTDASSAPLPGVSVRIHNASGVLVTSATTNAAGDYLTTGLPAGGYFAKTSNTFGYVDELYDDIACLSCAVTSGRSIPVDAGATSGGIDFALAAGGRISGTVNDSNGGAPLSGLTVNIYDASGSLVTSDVTDALGSYVSGSGLVTGTYFARTSNGLGYFEELYDDIFCSSCSVTTGTSIPVTLGTTTSGVDFSLVRGGRIAGVVSDAATGQALQGVTLQIYTAAGSQILSVTGSSLTGSYGTPALAPGSYFVRTSNSLGYVNELHDDIPCSICSPTGGTPVVVTTGNTRVVNFALGRGGRISGTATDERTHLPLAGVTVQVYDASGSLVSTGTTNSAGSYTSGAGLPSGSYFARTANALGYLDELYNEQPCSPSCVVTTGSAIVVTAGSTTTGINFSLTAGGRISGTVTDVGTGLPISNVNVQVYNSSGSLVSSGISDSSGNYASGAGLVAGTYYARTSTGLGYLNELYDDIACVPGCTPTSGTPIPVSDAMTTPGIHFALARGGQITGRVTDEASGVPLAGVMVAFYRSSGSLISSSSTNLSGSYTSLGLSTASYFAKTSNALGYADELYDDTLCSSCAVTGGRPIGVVEGATTPAIDFVLFNGPTLSIGPAALSEGDAGVTNAVFTVALSRATTSTVTVDFATADGSASADVDYLRTTGTILFPPGTTTQTLTVDVQGDLLNELNETFFVTLSNPSNARIETGQAQGTILNDDPLPSASIGDVTLTEGDSGATSALFNVTLSAPSGQTVTLSFATADGSATAGSDYGSASGTLSFPPGTTSQTLTVELSGDLSNELDETFFVNLSGATNATLATGQATGTILNDDPLPSLSIDDVTVREPHTGTTLAVFTVTLSSASGQAVSVKFATADGTAKAGLDYAASSGMLTFPPGTTSQNVGVVVFGDRPCEGPEAFFVKLSDVANATLERSQGVGTILPALPLVSIDDVTVKEGDAEDHEDEEDEDRDDHRDKDGHGDRDDHREEGEHGRAVFKVRLSRPSQSTVSVDFATADGTATAGSDYTAKSGTLTFRPGRTSRRIRVLVRADSAAEPAETFFVNLTNAKDATIGKAQGVGTILDDDARRRDGRH